MKKILKPEFFARPVLDVAPDLLGKFLILNRGENTESYMITEVEAYNGENDLACHASKGRTKRTEGLYGVPGTFYIYLIYGMHHMLNVVTDTLDYPAAVLIRGIEGMNGPGRLTKKLGIDWKLHGILVTKKSLIYFEDRGILVSIKDITQTPRIGVDYAGPIWSKKKWRFVLNGPKKKSGHNQ